MSGFSISRVAASPSTLGGLRDLAQGIADSTRRISADRRIASPSDDPARFAIANSIQAQLKATQAATDNLGRASGAVSAALQSAQNIADQLDSLKNVVI